MQLLHRQKACRHQLLALLIGLFACLCATACEGCATPSSAPEEQGQKSSQLKLVVRYDYTTKEIIFHVENKSDQAAPDLQLHYVNTSEVRSERMRVTLATKREDTLGLGDLAAKSSSEEKRLPVTFNSEKKATFMLQLLCQQEVVDSQDVKVALCPITLVPIGSTVLVGENPVMHFRIEKDPSSQIEMKGVILQLSRQYIYTRGKPVVSLGNKIFLSQDEDSRVLNDSSLLANDIRFTIQNDHTQQNAGWEISLYDASAYYGEISYEWIKDKAEALLEGAYKGDAALVKRLIEEGVKVDVHDSNDNTP